MNKPILTLLILLALATGGYAQTATDAPAGKTPADAMVLDLETACRIAIEKNPSLAAAEARVRAAAARIRQARSAWLPSIDASATASRVNLSDADFSARLAPTGAFAPAATLKDPEEYYSADITATWLLFNGFERRFSILAAKYGHIESRAAQKDAQRLLLSAVADAFFAVQLSRENIAIAEADMAFNRRLAREAKVRHDFGTGPLSDILNFDIQVNAARAALIAAKSSHESAMAGLAALLGNADAAFPEPTTLSRLDTEPPERMQRPDTGTLFVQAMAHRPDLAETDARIQQAEAAIGVARAGYFPDIALTGTLDGDRAGNADFDDDDFGDTVALTLSYNLFAGGRTRAQIAEARHNRQAAEEARQNLENAISAEVRQAVAQLAEAQEQLALQRENARLVRRNRDLVEKEYLAGQTSLVRLNEAQRDLVRAQGRLAQARVSLDQAWYAVEVSTARNIAPFMTAK